MRIGRPGRMLLAAAALALAAAPRERASSWSFEDAGEAKGCARAPGRKGQGLKLDGRRGLVVPDAPGLRGERGFTLECWIKSDVGPGPCRNIISKPGEYMLRVDPAHAGGTISLFVRTADGRWEPRARGPRLEPGKWLHLIAVWSRRRAYLWVNRAETSVARPGACPATKSPVYIGGPASGGGGAGFVGVIDEVRILPYALPYGEVQRRLYRLPRPGPGPRRTDPNFEFDAGAEGWSGDAGAQVKQGALCATLAGDDAMLRVAGLRIDAASHPVCSVSLAADKGVRAVLLFAMGRRCKQVPFRLIPDGRLRWYTLRCAQQPPWEGEIDAMGLRIEGGAGARVRIDSIRLGRASCAPPDVRVLSLSPERRINALRTPVEVTAWVRNFGGPARGARVRLTAAAGVEVAGDAERTLDVGFDETKELTWRVQAAAPTKGWVRVEVSLAGAPGAAMQRPIEFARDPRAAAIALARSRAWRRAGYPRAMDFRHLWPGSVRFLEHNTALLVDFIGDKIPAAIEFKRRYPGRLVLMQVNDEPSGIWGSWHCVPREFAVKEGLKFDPLVFPMPAFRGYWLLGAGAALNEDWPANAEELTLRVEDPTRFVLSRRGRRELRDALVVRRVNGKLDWLYSEFVSVVRADERGKTITLKRWPRAAVGPWRAFRAGAAYVAPSVGDIYRMKGHVIKTWIPNLTKFCPVDPRTGLNACAWWARHFARLWHERIAREEPHPDGYEFDGLNQGALGDCNNDGVVDGCVFDGVDYWLLGLYDFFRLLRAGGPGWKGLGDALILADSSSVWGPRLLGALNGSENEEFPSFAGPAGLPEGMDLYRLWCARAAAPACSYLQGRFQCDTYLERDWARVRSRGKFHPDALVRFCLAAACMGDGIYTFRTGSRRDIDAILEWREALEYPWDEYHAGREGHYNWLGRPLGPARRMTDHLGPNLLSAGEDANRWALEISTRRAKASGPRVVVVDGRRWIEADVLALDSTGLPRPAGPAACRRVVLRSAVSRPLRAGREYCLDVTVWAEPVYAAREGKRFGDVMRPVGFALECAGRLGRAQYVLAGRRPRPVAITLRAPGAAPGRVVVLIGATLGPVRLADLQLREGCAEVFARRFEHGLALANGSALSPYTFDLRRLDSRSFRRFAGAQAPDVNTGRPVGARVAVPPQDGLLLMAR